MSNSIPKQQDHYVHSEYPSQRPQSYNLFQPQLNVGQYPQIPFKYTTPTEQHKQKTMDAFKRVLNHPTSVMVQDIAKVALGILCVPGFLITIGLAIITSRVSGIDIDNVERFPLVIQAVLFILSYPTVLGIEVLKKRFNQGS